ncbi:FMN-binding negative transcriptional regulator [Arenibacter sp. M-2]|uniref:FMN-binding negative transcriptional regulator n=1 Tax=Arenibacter sp. M-2 TaxID=3053612 RepID=UPI00257042FB|nr:FMN-binding negative transcriptional regulator [Arenibacter sp. M-2]MDL5514886.1 FMN-binding negative transcriptional regulator [Arenibacter sp. M-2]
MYTPKIFEITDHKIIEQFIKENGFATLVTKGATVPTATHIPLELEESEKGNKILVGHISKANEQWKEFKSAPSVLVIFLSPINQYISSSWYKKPNAPTWNYLSVHISGKLKILSGDNLWNSVSRLTDRYERTQKCPISLNTLSITEQKQINGIVGFQISIDKIEAQFKLSQNRTEEDFKSIINELRLSNDLGASLMADTMEREKNTQKN